MSGKQYTNEKENKSVYFTSAYMLLLTQYFFLLVLEKAWRWVFLENTPDYLLTQDKLHLQWVSGYSEISWEQWERYPLPWNFFSKFGLTGHSHFDASFQAVTAHLEVLLILVNNNP